MKAKKQVKQYSQEMNNKVEYILCAAYKFKEGYRTPKMEEIKAKDGTMIEEIYHEPHREVFRMALGWRHADKIGRAHV